MDLWLPRDPRNFTPPVFRPFQRGLTFSNNGDYWRQQLSVKRSLSSAENEPEASVWKTECGNHSVANKEGCAALERLEISTPIMRRCVLLVLLALFAGDPSAAEAPICPIVCVKEFASYFEPLRLNALEVLAKEINKLNRTIAACRQHSGSQLETSVRSLVEALNEDRHLEIELQRVKNESYLEKRDLQARLSVALTDAANATEKTKTLVTQLEQLRNQPCNATNDDEEEIKLPLLTLNGKSYYFEFNATGNWTEAKEFCEKNNMHLATLMSEAELENLHSHLSEKGESYTFWVSASDANQPPGHFRWRDGTDLQKESTLWDKERGQPDHFGDGHQTCVGIGSEGRLVDDPCDSHQNKLLICEKSVN